MRSRFVSSFALPAVAFFAAFAPPARAAVQNRITSAVTNGNRVALPHSIPPRALHSTDLGNAPADRRLDELSVRFNMTAAQQADLTQLLADQQNPNSANYHKWLTPEQFGARFGLSSSDLAKVSSWLTSQGFTVTDIARSSNSISFTGTVAQVQQAFGTSLHMVDFNGEQHITNLTDPVLPSAISGVVAAVTGLSDFRLKPRARKSILTAADLHPEYNYTNNGTLSHFIAPGDFYTIYDMNPLLSSSCGASVCNGTGVTIAVMGQSNLRQADAAAFRSAASLPANAPTVQLVGTDPGIVTGDVDEAQLDVEWSGAAAPGAKILFIYSKDVLDTSLPYAITNAVAPIITVSYGLCESGYPLSIMNSINQNLQQANAQGITVVSSSGDAGAADCDVAGLATEGLAADFPSTSPFVTSTGGTMFNEGSGSYWNASNGTNAGSAIGYIPEQAWNETTAAAGLDAGGSGGGGASAFFSKPAWQAGIGVPADLSRDVPDISFNSGASHDGYVVCTNSSCTNGFVNASNSITVFGGTSAAAPTFAGVLAIVEQKLGVGTSAATGLGNVGPVLYGLASIPKVFHDTIAGNNSIPCIQGTPNCPNGGSFGFNAGTGYDQATGLGSIDVNMMALNWNNAIPTGGGSTIGHALSATTLTTASAFCGISTGTMAFNVTVTGTSGTPSGTVQFLVDNAPVGSPATLSNGAVTYTLNTSSLSSGGHNVSVVYSGDATFAGSKGSLFASDGSIAPIDVVSSTQADFSLTPCTSPLTVRSGAVAPGITFTLTPFNGFKGNITLSASADADVAAAYAFSVQPVVISSTSGVTTSFVFTAYKSSAKAAATPLQANSGQSPLSGKAPWYAVGSGATLACMILVTVPRRRRWGTLLAVMLSVAAIGAIGCGSSSSSTGGGGGTTPPTITNAAPGSYTVTITGVSGTLVHSAKVALVVQ